MLHSMMVMPLLIRGMGIAEEEERIFNTTER
jgi:hypothetical protein